MGRVLNINLTTEQRRELELLYKQSDNHVLRQRCQIILLKTSNRKTSDICEIIGIKNQNQVNKWVKRYKSEYSTVGINCLRNIEGQGRKSIFDAKTESEIIQKVVKTERQKLDNAKVILKKELNKSFNIKTLKNFITGGVPQALAGDINE